MVSEGQGGLYLSGTSKSLYQTAYGLRITVRHAERYHKHIHFKKN